MTRVPLIGEERGDLAAFIARVKAERGKLINLYRVLLNSPTIAAGWLDFNSTIRYQTTLDAALREMIILRVSVLNGAEYQARIHGASHALKAGLSAEQIAALSDWQDSTLFSPAQRGMSNAEEAGFPPGACGNDGWGERVRKSNQIGAPAATSAPESTGDIRYQPSLGKLSWRPSRLGERPLLLCSSGRIHRAAAMPGSCVRAHFRAGKDVSQ